MAGKYRESGLDVLDNMLMDELYGEVDCGA